MQLSNSASRHFLSLKWKQDRKTECWNIKLVEMSISFDGERDANWGQGSGEESGAEESWLLADIMGTRPGGREVIKLHSTMASPLINSSRDVFTSELLLIFLLTPLYPRSVKCDCIELGDGLSLISSTVVWKHKHSAGISPGIIIHFEVNFEVKKWGGVLYFCRCFLNVNFRVSLHPHMQITAYLTLILKYYNVTLWKTMTNNLCLLKNI